MKKEKKKLLSDAEIQILQVLSRIGPATAHTVRENLTDGDKTAYSTVITLLQRMEAKGHVTHCKAEKGKAFLFEAKIDTGELRENAVQSLVLRHFHNNPIPLLTTLVETRGLTREEIRELRELLDRAGEGETEENRK